MTEKLKRKELIRLYGDLDKEFNEYIDEAEDRMLAVTRGHAQGLQDATAATARLKNELVQANRSWAASQERVRVVENDNAALDAEFTEYINEVEDRIHAQAVRESVLVADRDAALRDADLKFKAFVTETETREYKLLEELRLANEGWASKSRELSDANQELTKLRGQLSRARAALEPLRLALFPAKIDPFIKGGLPTTITVPAQPFDWTPNVSVGVAPITGVMWNRPTDQQYVGANYDPFLEAAQTLVTKPNGPTWGELMEKADKVDRLNEAGYSCATEKAKIEDVKVQAEAYAGLS